MDEISLQFIEIFNVFCQQTPDNDSITQASNAALELLSSPESINALFNIILNSGNMVHKKYAPVYLGKCIKLHLDEIQDGSPIVGQCLEVVSKEANEEIQRLTINAIDELPMKGSEQMILEFAQNALTDGKPYLINAAILLCKIIVTELDEIHGMLKFFIDLINAGIQTLPPLHPLDFAFILGHLIDDESEPFFNQMWEESINFVCQSTNDINTAKPIINLLNESMCGCIPLYVNPNLIIERFLPLLGDTSIDLDVNICLLSSINYAIDIEGVLDDIEIEEFFSTTLQKIIQISAMAYNPDDSLYASEVDVFEDFCVPFSSSELDTSDLFIETVLSFIDECYPQPETRPGIIIALAYIIGDGAQMIVESLPQICQLLTESVNDEARIVRDSAAFAIQQIALYLESDIEDYVEDLVNAMLQSMASEVTEDMVISFKEVLISARDTDPIFEDAYSFLMEKMSTANEISLQYYFPCLTELCIKSKKKIIDVFEQLVPILFDTIEQCSEILNEKAVLCLTSLSTSSSELFAPYFQKLVELIIAYLDSESETLMKASLLSFGKLMENYSEQLNSILPELIPILIKIGAKDLRQDLIDEIKEKQEKLEMLEITGETEFDVEEEDKNDDETISTYAIPSLAISVFGSIALNYPSVVPEYIDQVIEDLRVQMENPSEDALEINTQAISLLSRGIAKSELPTENRVQVASLFCQSMIELIRVAKRLNLAADAFAAIGQIIELFGVESIGKENVDQIISIISDALEGKIESQEDNSDYIKEFHESLCAMTCELIASLGLEAPAVLETIIQKFFELATAKKTQTRDLGLQILGHLVEHSSENLDVGVKLTIYNYVINGIRLNSQHAAFALNQFTNNDGEIIMQNIDDLMSLIYEKLETPNKKKASSYVAFIDNLVAAVGEIRRNVLKDNFPLDHFAPICLSLMPAGVDSSTNLDMMNFYVWMAEKMNIDPASEFATVAIKLFMVPPTEIGGIAEDDSGILQRVLEIMIQCLNKIGSDAEALIQSVCDGDQFKLERIQNVLSSVQ